MSTPLVHILVVNWNGKEHLEACFDSLVNQTYGNFRIVLVDNASADGSIQFVRDRYGPDSRVEIIECGENLGWSRGNNRGIEHAIEAGAGYVFLLNNDTAAAPDAIERLVAFAEQHPKAGAIAPKMLLFDQPWIVNSIGIVCTIVGSAWDDGLGRADGPRWSEAKQVLGVCGGAMFLRAEALRAAGVFPADFEIYLDDLDLCLRMWDAGYECWSCPAATVRHKFSATMGEGARARRKYYLNTRNRLRLILRNFPARELARVLAHYAVSEIRAIGRASRNGELWKAAAHVRSWFAAVAYRTRAMAQRSAMKSAGNRIGTFWDLIRTDLYFFPGIELPNRGWYAPTQRAWSDHGRRDSVALHPISSHAYVNVTAGELSVTHANCYPELGETNLEIRVNDRTIATLTSSGAPRSERFAVEGGTLEIIAHRLFDAESTKERFDIGGWIAIWPPNSEQIRNR